MEMDVEPDYTREARLLHCVSVGGTASLAFMLLLMGGLAVTGSMLATKTRLPCPATQDAADAVAGSFSITTGWHDALGTLLVLTLFFLIAMSILFSLNVVFFDSRRTRRPWAQTIMAAVLAICILASVVFGNVYSSRMKVANHWLLAPQGGYASDTVVTKGPVASAGIFSTFVAFHAIIFPMLSVMVIALMWPPFCEFARRPEDQKKRTKLTLKRDIRL